MPFRATADGSINHQPDCFKGLANCNHLLGREARYLKVNLAQFAAMTETDSCELVELVLGACKRTVLTCRSAIVCYPEDNCDPGAVITVEDCRGRNWR